MNIRRLKITSLILFGLLLPQILYSQIVVNSGMQVRVKDGSQMEVTGNTTINSGADFTLGGDMTVNGNFINNGSASAFVITSDASNTGSLIISGTSTGSSTVERYLSDNAWHFISPSTTGIVAGDFFWDNQPIVWAAYLNEVDDSWTYLSDVGTSMPVGKGYKMWLDANSKTNKTALMEGSLRTTDLSVNLSKSGGGWNLIGNPFPSAIDWDEGSWGTNTTGSVYVWDTAYNDGDFRVWNGVEGGLSDGIIPVSQGFMVEASSAGSFNIPADAQTHNSIAFYKADQDKSSTPYLKLQMNFGSYGSTVYIGFPDNGSVNFDQQGDALKLYSNSTRPQLYAIEGENKLCINANEPLDEDGHTVAIHLDQVVNGSYQLRLSQLENIAGIKVTLE
ncbi:MAG: hypothetical protein GQ527_02510, partial [Bacteroidales bacterium]|nr:hypothetical protein [Bacteroidales bacterium]